MTIQRMSISITSYILNATLTSRLQSTLLQPINKTQLIHFIPISAQEPNNLEAGWRRKSGTIGRNIGYSSISRGQIHLPDGGLGHIHLKLVEEVLRRTRIFSVLQGKMAPGLCAKLMVGSIGRCHHKRTVQR
jgi:hypothetical protein